MDAQALLMSEPAAVAPAVAGPVVWWLRLEGLAMAALTLVLYARTGAAWWLLAVLWLVPDLSVAGYMAGPLWGSRGYNTVHSYLLPIGLACAGLWLPFRLLLPVALIWANHIAVDRLLGYGLKYPNGFGFTHLARPRGKIAAPTR